MNTNQSYAIVTGASQGLGRAIAEECAGRGLNLALVALPGTGLPEVAEIIRMIYHVSVEIWELDLTEPEGPRCIADWAVEHGVRVELLVNNAGTGYNGLFRESTLGENDSTIELNIRALVRLTHLLLPSLAESTGSVLNVASLAAYFPMPYMPVYSPSKSFVVNFSLALREELKGTGINVSVLCPNGIRTNAGCRTKIDAQGFAGRITCFYPDEVARYAIKKLLRRKAVIVPGWINRILRTVGTFVPRSLVFWVVSRHWGTQGEPNKAAPLFKPVSSKPKSAVSNGAL
jgi:hypothetical protein